MAQKTDLNVSPYYDDYADSKNFHRVLFKPSAAIQARELTQLQSILQNQIERFGSHIFKEGSIILGARTNYDNQYFGVRVEDINPNGAGVQATESFRVDAIGKFYQGETSGVVCKVVNTSQKTSDDPLTLHVKYQRTGNSGSTFYTEFLDAETLNEVTQDSNNLGGYSSASSNNQFKVYSIAGSTNVGSMVGSAANISEGIIYTRGMFVRVPEQTLILEKYSNSPSYKVGVDVAETLTSYSEDTSLLDNAQGSTNENAPGADRLTLTMTLAKKAITATDSTDFIELMRLSAGEVVKKQEITEYNRLQETMARRTFDESGDYTLQPFTMSYREHLNDLSNNGVYTSTDTPSGNANKFISVISSGKAYVRGYEIDKQVPTFLTFDKARTTQSKNNVASAFRIGNFLKIDTIYGLPDISATGDSNAYSEIGLYDTAGANVAGNGSANGSLIGYARVRAYEQFDTSSDALYLFDVQMFTQLTTASVSLAKGQKVKGTTSGATGIVAEAVSSGTTVKLHSVVGTFNTSDTLRKHQNSSGGVAVSAIRNYDIGRIRSVFQDRGTGNFQEFGANVVLEDNQTLTGSGTVTLDGDSSNDTITGISSRFTSELQEGDSLLLANNATTTVVSVASDTSVTVTDITSGTSGTISGNIVRQRAKFYKQDQTVAISGLPNNGIKEITGIETEIVRRMVVTTSDGNGDVTVSSTDGTFVAFSDDDYHAVVETTSTASRTPIALTSSNVTVNNGANSGSVVIDVGVASKTCKVIVTVQRGTVAAATKTLVKGACAVVNTANSTTNYGNSYQHTDITVGVADVYEIRGVFEGGNALNPSGDGSTFVTAPTPPSFRYTADAGSNALSTAGTEIVGNVSNARGILIENDSNVCYFYYVDGSAKFQSGEGVTFTDGTDKAGTIGSLTAGSKEITDNFVFDDGQRDGYYGISKITRKKNAPTPNGPLMIVFDYFTHSAGNTFNGTSYSGMEIDKIPNYVADRFDPTASFDSDGDFALADSIDYRPVAARLLGTAPNNNVDSPQNISGISTYPFSYGSTAFEGNGSLSNDLAKIGSNITLDYDHYLPRKDRVFLTSLGEFVVVTGEPSDSPKKGAKIDNAIEIAEVFVPAFTPDVGEVETKLIQHRRYTMRDIDGIQRRLTQLETAVSLSMLEEKTETLQVLDDEGFDRFKSGFVVDPFKGHGVGDVFHPDYGIAVDQREGIARPAHRTNYFDLEFNSGVSSNITKSGDLLTLPFTETNYISANKASQQVNVNPYDVANFVGRLELSPDKDVWHDMEQLPSITSSQEGSFDAVLAGVELGTVWNDWQQTWSGTPIVTSNSDNVLEGAFQGIEPEEFEVVRGGRRGGRGRRRIPRGRGRRAVTTTVTRTIPTREQRTGIITNIVEDIVTTRNDRVVGVSAVNFMRTIDITITGELLKPNTALNVFFDNIQVNAHCTPASATYGVGGATAKGTQLVTDNRGKLNATFTIPNDDTLRFETGVRTLKVTDTTTVDSALSTTSAFTNFMANGSLTSQQTEIINTRNGRLVQESVSESRANQVTTSNTTTRWVDPLAQSFLVEQEEGVFINSIDVFFSAKDAGGLPVTCSIRQMLNGSPTQKIMPFAEKTLYPSEVSVSANAQTSTKFSFPSPVYLNPNTEYCFVLESNSNAYLTWVGQMGDFDIHTKEPIDKQPYAGVLFKSQNSSTWTPEQMQDLKFNINRCLFNTGGTAVLENKAIPNKKLKSNPIETISGDRDRLKVHHQSHGMYDQDSNVTISGVEGDKDNGVLSVTSSASGTGVVNTYTGVGGTADNNGSGATFDITLDTTTSISSIKINNPGFNYAVNETVTIRQDSVGGSGATTFCVITVASIEDTLGGIPIGKINTTHTTFQSFDMDSYEVNISLGNHLGATESTRAGGDNVFASENMYYDVIHTLVPNVVYPKTTLTSNMFKTSTGGVNANTTGNSYVKASSSQTLVLNDNNFMVTSGIVASQINETNEMASVKSFRLSLGLTSESNFVSPVIDLGSIGANTVMNRINHVTTGSDLAANTTLVEGTQPDGDNNAAIYCTRLVQLENPASQLKVIFDGFRAAGTADGEIKTYFKLLKADSTLPIEELGWTEFATTNVPDADSSKFRSYEYDATNLEEFVGFSIKIVMKSKDTTMPCAIKAFRGLALA